MFCVPFEQINGPEELASRIVSKLHTWDCLKNRGTLKMGGVPSKMTHQ